MITCIIEMILLFAVDNIETSMNSDLHVDEVSVRVSEELLPMIDISNDSILQDIFREVIDSDEEPSEKYAVIMNDYYDGTIVEIIRVNDDDIDGDLYWTGYILMEEKKFYIAKIYSNYTLSYVTPKQKELFKIASNNFSSRNMPRWFYYILGDVYAGYSSEEGWIWSDGKPDE